MSETMGQVATCNQEGTVRRQANEVRDANADLELQVNRLESVRVRMYGAAEQVNRANPDDTVPEPVRNDLEELQYQLSTYRQLLERLGQVTNVVVEL